MEGAERSAGDVRARAGIERAGAETHARAVLDESGRASERASDRQSRQLAGHSL